MEIKFKFNSKSSYDLYFQLYCILDTYLMKRIDEYIFLTYYDRHLSNCKLVNISEFDLFFFRRIYEYDYKVFKVLLFLYWDLEYYLENDLDYVKNTLITDSENIEFLKIIKIKFRNKIKSDDVFLNQIQLKLPLKLSTYLEINLIFNAILKYDIYSKIYNLDTKYKNNVYIEKYKKYSEYNNLIRGVSDELLRVAHSRDGLIDKSYYQDYIDCLYKEWSSENKIHLMLKYTVKLKKLELEFINLLKVLK